MVRKPALRTLAVAAITALTTALAPISPAFAADVTVDAPNNGTPVTVTTAAADERAVVRFTGTRTHHLQVFCTEKTGPTPTFTVLDPTGREIGRSRCGYSRPFELSRLPMSSDYQVVLTPNGGAFSASVKIRDFMDADALGVVNGTRYTVRTTEIGQDARVSFELRAGQRVHVLCKIDGYAGFSSVSVVDSAEKALPDSFGNCSRYADQPEEGIGVVTAPADGVYTFLVDADWDLKDWSVQVRLFGVPDDVTAEAATDGTPVVLTTTRPGQRAQVTFTLDDRSDVLIQCTSVTPGETDIVGMTLNAPNERARTDTCWHSDGVISKFSGVIQRPAGAHSLLLDPAREVTGTYTVRVFRVPAAATVRAAIDGPPVTIATTVPGQHAKVSFDAAAGDRIYANCALRDKVNGSSQYSGGSAEANLYDPAGDRVYFAAGLCGVAGSGTGPTTIDTRTLTTAGTYTIDLNVPDAATNAATVQLLRVPADVTARTTIDGGDVTVTTTAVGQNGVVSFPATAGQRVSVRCDAAFSTGLGVRDPGGAWLGSTYCPDGRSLTLTLVTAGTYQVEVDPRYDRTGPVTVQVRSAT
jgi:hypothetical protein